MKILATLFTCLALMACKTSKKSLDSNKNTENELVGIIHVNENQCPIYIEITEALNPGKSLAFKTAYPINLKDGMKKKGLKVKFSYTTSKAMSPEGCGVEAIINLETIEVIP